ncbi:ABC transporter substrate-binding protein (plasmid) [Martelella lutilitoris]|uniref:ABC transporter substrate-binding protein n=1 Tax=Martelella lutilitoris TaxID=2583532 RepID=A0A7T7KNL6_9HYPH|nr:ABC transporter substrate-binding protein [Martelella lutilitoris]QQM32987.1 ABC transporter substrate-binding protein [Martelella lutilitoris]QRX65329.1 ABC transporter substrate-binding protein [Dysgonomonadaceae bacterium zrk40]
MAYINKLIRPTRRGVLRGMGAGLAASVLGSPAVLRAQTAGKIRMGYITPETGPLGLFGETDGYTVQKIREALGGRLQSANGDVYELEILERDSQSNPNKAAEIAGDLILNDEVHLLVPASTTDTILPAMEQAELYETPSISAGAPWQAVIMPRGGGEFDWTYHFFWGLDEALNTFVGLWNGLETNRKVGMLFPQNIDGETWGNEEYGLPVPTRAAGYEVTIPGYFQPRTNDFSAQISTFKQAGCDIIGGITYPDDLKTFVTQCNQQGFKPKAVTVAAALLFPGSVEAMGPLGNGMTTEVWWTPAFPFKSSITGQTSREIADQWESEQNRQWTQPLGYSHSVLEVAIDVLKRSADPLDREANREALAATDLDTVVGHINFSGQPHKNVCTTPIFGGQWVKGEKWPYDLKIVDNSVNQLFEPQQKIVALNW